MKVVVRAVAVAVVGAALLNSAGCGKDNKRSQQSVDAQVETEPASGAGAKDSGSTEGQKNSDLVGKQRTAQGLPASADQQELIKGTITEVSKDRLEQLLQVLQPTNPKGTTASTVESILKGVDPKLAAALLRCPAVLLGSAESTGILSVLTNLISGQGASPLGGLFGGQTWQPSGTQAQPSNSGVNRGALDAAACLLQALL